VLYEWLKGIETSQGVGLCLQIVAEKESVQHDVVGRNKPGIFRETKRPKKLESAKSKQAAGENEQEHRQLEREKNSNKQYLLLLSSLLQYLLEYLGSCYYFRACSKTLV